MKLELIERIKDVALYETFINGMHSSYEVHIIRQVKPTSTKIKQPDGTFKLVKFTSTERLAGNEDFGKWGWSFANKQLAKECFEDLVKKNA